MSHQFQSCFQASALSLREFLHCTEKRATTACYRDVVPVPDIDMHFSNHLQPWNKCTLVPWAFKSQELTVKPLLLPACYWPCQCGLGSYSLKCRCCPQSSIVVSSFSDGKEMQLGVEVVALMNSIKLHSIILTHLVAFFIRLLSVLSLIKWSGLQTKAYPL